MKRVALIVVAGLVLGLAAPLAAQTAKPATTNMEILAQKVKADKKLLVAQTMQLTDQEGTAFWPIYEAYQADLQKINARLKTAVEGYAKDYNAGTMTDAKASALTTEAIAIEEALVALKKTYVGKLTGVITPVKIARYIQVENKVRALVNADLAAGIPFVQ
jgi:Spy/CpxP family protein refolding chaperone